ncbi:hypothetical protein CJP72_21100 [Citrobacter sp. NCU1]|uniref:hypothetical protein n=1 Tax=Citrobacter sp. NCU1 TaxID=2026683 RepID=UPI001391F92B|nr:hypothetical protein [Citrobacter sp. NCU1]NDO83175.1 hypothetical protein [Citrobacter sp. NCU1]
MMHDPAVSVSHGGNIEIDTYSMSDYSVGTNHEGKALYVVDDVEMTDEQLEDNMHYYESDDSDDDEYDSAGDFPETITEQLYQINDVLGGGAAEFYASELLGIGESRMGEVMRGTHQSRDAIQSHAEATLHHMAAAVGMNGDMLMSELNKDIATVRGMRSKVGTEALHAAITDAMTGNYHGAMTRWNRLRGALQSIR